MSERLILRLIVCWRKSSSERVQNIRKCCIFKPSCSAYSFRAIRKFGLISGLKLTIYRLYRCNPNVSEGGYDPLPGKSQQQGN
jgi:putative membrane protein insertion efficiency factor